MASACDKLFVYGTLRRGFDLHGHLSGRAEFLGEGTIHGLLYDLGGYPGALASGSRGSRIRGEVYALREVDRQLAEIDEAEEYFAGDVARSLFVRRLADVDLASGGTIQAWTYFLPGEPAHARLIPEGDYAKRRPATDRVRESAPEEGTGGRRP